MAFLNVYLGDNTEYFAVKNNQLSIRLQTGDTRVIPVQDINSVVIENNKITVSVYALQYLMESRVAVYLCDNHHIPNSQLLPYNNHYSQLKVFNLQLTAAKPLCKQLWAGFVRQKIFNQAMCLKLLGLSGAERLLEYSKNVVSGDTDNRESVAATYYWKQYFNGAHTRNDEIFQNIALNYGYSLVRGQIARSIIAHGLQSFIGIHHCNKLNAFNLADDLIESYRPYVDLFVAKNFALDIKKIDAEIKRKLLKILNLSVSLDGQTHSLPNAIEITVDSFISSLRNNKCEIILPNLIDAGSYRYE
jgi:CRISPR-associated protein Cas1